MHHAGTNAYSEDLRRKIVEAVERGMPKAEAAKTFGVGVSSVKRYVATAREGKPLAPKRRPGSKPKLGQVARRLLEADLEERPASTLPQRREFLRRVAGVKVRNRRCRGRLGAWGSAEKRLLGATERDEFLRAAWRVLMAGKIGAERFVFVDECGTNTSLYPLYAWSRKGERARAEAPRNWGKNVTLLARMGLEGMRPCVAVEGATTKAVLPGR